MNSRVLGHSRRMRRKEFQSSGRCFVGNSSKASMQINPRRRDEKALASIAQISGRRRVRPSTLLFARSKASVICSGIDSTLAISCFKRAANTPAADCSLCAWKSQYMQAMATLSPLIESDSVSITRELVFMGSVWHAISRELLYFYTPQICLPHPWISITE